MFNSDKCECNASCYHECMCDWVVKKEWQGLSYDEISECLSKTKWNDIDYCPDHDVFASHIEQALKEKNNE